MEDPLPLLELCDRCETVLRKTYRYCPGCGKPCRPEADGPPAPSAVNPNRVGIFGHVLMNILCDLNGDPRLREVFGDPVVEKLVVVADNNDLRIEEGGRVQLTEEQSQLFLAVLDETVRRNAAS